ncbi:NAD+ synthase, partial [Reticulomyxa filosa]
CVCVGDGKINKSINKQNSWYEKIQEHKHETSESGADEENNYVPVDAKELCGRLFHTCYMGTKNSSKDTQRRASALAKDIGCYHYEANIDTLVESLMQLFITITGKTPKFKAFGGTSNENLALQNIQVLQTFFFFFFFKSHFDLC